MSGFVGNCVKKFFIFRDSQKLLSHIIENNYFGINYAHRF